MTAAMTLPRSSRPWERAVVFGLGASGRAAAELLLDRGVTVVALDRRTEPGLELGEFGRREGLELRLGSQPERLPADVDGVVVSPGVPWDLPALERARADGVPVIAEVELAFAFLDGPVVGITGSNGKSTTTALAGALLRGAGFESVVCGNIGVPLSSCVNGPPGRVFVVELSSFQLEGIDAFHPRAAALLNLSPDHLDRHRDVSRYLAAKTALFRNQAVEDIAVLNADDPHVAAVATAARRRFFSRRRPVEDGCYLDNGTVVEAVPGSAPQVLFHVETLRLRGVHNLENAMAAALLARAMGAPSDEFSAVLSEVEGLPHRMEEVRRVGGVIWIDDSKATNVGATVRSLEGFEPGSVHLILGGRAKGADFSELAVPVARVASRVYLVGEAGGEIGAVLGREVAVETSGDLERAVAAAAEAARPGETVLLSPACASFDQYRNYAERGEHFARLVAGLADSDGGSSG